MPVSRILSGLIIYLMQPTLRHRASNPQTPVYMALQSAGVYGCRYRYRHR